MEKTIGILGGMGPEATAYLFRKIIRHTKADKDQEHLKVIIFNNPKIPDRTDFILEKGTENPLPYLAEAAKELQRSGADFIIIPCNTAHYFYEDICRAVSIPVINMIEAVADEILSDPIAKHKA
jgi:aspartate racemase